MNESLVAWTCLLVNVCLRPCRNSVPIYERYRLGLYSSKLWKMEVLKLLSIHDRAQIIIAVRWLAWLLALLLVCTLLPGSDQERARQLFLTFLCFIMSNIL
ncbi:hypothetical protein NC653_039293 [Populus alba x Populus x berolinensis]|uniref:Uncharacterized protein n=1 Tax=Populus alba x Populus x berolinensis TaxID=444605 RepID=A0AAD6PR61_9ROSI|nr:hypothetical protein NC653_039293 [Populus alba x Populus x berolinensis]